VKQVTTLNVEIETNNPERKTQNKEQKKKGENLNQIKNGRKNRRLEEILKREIYRWKRNRKKLTRKYGRDIISK
jgi:hypothetical protein